MQATAPEATDLTQEPEEIQELYGLNDKRVRDCSAGNACWPAGWSSAACG